MAKELYHGSLTKHDDWGAVEKTVDGVTTVMPADGQSVQDYIKETLDSKIGELYNYVSTDKTVSQYWGFADVESRENYLLWNTAFIEKDEEKMEQYSKYSNLRLCVFDAPAQFTISLNILFTEEYQTATVVSASQKNNYIYFKVNVKDSSNNNTNSDLNVSFTFNNNKAIRKYNRTCRSSDDVVYSLLIDDYISIGTNNVTIQVNDDNTGLTTQKTITINSKELTLISSFKFNEAITIIDSEGNRVSGTEQLVIPISSPGAGGKKIEWFIDGELVETVNISEAVPDYSNNQALWLKNINKGIDYAAGKHSVHARVSTDVNGVTFYGDTLYYDFMLLDARESNYYEILLSGKMANGHIATTFDEVIINAIQYEQSTLTFATYDSENRALTVNISVNDALTTQLSSTNGKVNYWEYTSPTYGIIPISLEMHNTYQSDVQTEVLLTYNIEESSVSIEEHTSSLIAKFSARGRSNSESNRNIWEYISPAGNKYSATFNNVKWNDVSGWSNNALVLSNGATVTLDINPFSFYSMGNGVTFEIDFETVDAKSDSASVMQIGGYETSSTAASIKITATSATLTSNLKSEVTTNYKDNERTKLAFVLNSKHELITNHNQMWIINNSIIERAINYSESDGFTPDGSETSITIGNPNSDVTVKIYNIRVYNTALTEYQEFSNYAIDSDNITKIVKKNDLFDAGTVSYDKLKNDSPIIIMTGDMPKLCATTNKTDELSFDVEYTNPTMPEYNFILKKAIIRRQGTSSLNYTCPNWRIYTQKDDNTTIQFPNLPGFENKVFTKDKMYYESSYINNDGIRKTLKRHPQTHQPTDGKITYAFKPGAFPTKVWTIKADYAESSMTHNTGIARWFNNINKEVTIPNVVNEVTGSDKVCKTQAQAAVETHNKPYFDATINKEMETYPFDIRTTIDGFPICVFYRLSETSENPEDTKLVFMGMFNFNNDKSSKEVFGFKKIEMYEPDKVDEDGNALTLKKTKIFDNSNVFSWEGSANEEACGKFLSIAFDAGAIKRDKNGEALFDSDGNVIPSYDPTDILDRSGFAAFETRYPDEDEITLSDETIIGGDLFNNSSSLESLSRWINFTKPAVDLRVYKKPEYQRPGNEYEDGYSLVSFNKATTEEVEAAKNDNTKLLYIQTNKTTDGTTNTYEQTTWKNGAIWKSRIDEDNNEIYLDAAGNDLLDQTNISLRVNIQIYYTKRDEIDNTNVKRVVTDKLITDTIYVGWVTNWQCKSIETLVGKTVKGAGKITKTTEGIYYKESTNDDAKSIWLVKYDVINADKSKQQIGDHNVMVFLTKKGNAYTYIDGYGIERKYNIISTASEGMRGAIKEITDYIGKTYMDFFDGELSNHFDIYKLASYYIYTKRFAAVDQMVKNIMLTTEDGKHWYYIHYDNDTINGVRNDAIIKYNWDVNRDTYDVSVNSYAYAGFQSVLWNNLEQSKLFMKNVKLLDSQMAKITTKDGVINKLTYDGACYWFDTMQADAWPERIVNASEDYKYLAPFRKNESYAKYLMFLQGNRKSHRHWWLRHRFDLIDAEWQSGEYSLYSIVGYVAGAKKGNALFTIKAASDFYFGYSTNNETETSGESGKFVKAGNYYTFNAVSDYNVGDPFSLYAPWEIEELELFGVNSSLMLIGAAESNYIPSRGTKLKKLIIGHENTDTLISDASGLGQLTQLQHLDIRGCANIANPVINTLTNLHVYEAENASIREFRPAPGAILYKVTLPSCDTKASTNNDNNDKTTSATIVRDYTKSSISTINLTDITFDYSFKCIDNEEGNKDGYFNYTPDAALHTLVLDNVTGDLDTYNFVKTWYNAIVASDNSFVNYSLTIHNMNWGTEKSPVSPDFMIKLKEAGFDTLNLTGKVFLSSMTYNQYSTILDANHYGSQVFNPLGSLVFNTSNTQFLYAKIDGVDYENSGINSIIEFNSGKTVNVGARLFPLDETAVITYTLFDANGSVMAVNGHAISGIFDLNTATGELIVKESTTESSCSIGIYAKSSVNGEYSTPGERRLQLKAKAVTVPTNWDMYINNQLYISGSSYAISNSNDVIIDLKHNFRITDTDIEKIEISIKENGTVIALGDNSVTTQYIKAEYFADDIDTRMGGYVRISRTDDASVNDIVYSINITPYYNTTLTNKKKGTTKILNTTVKSIIPSKFIVTYNNDDNSEYTSSILSENEYKAIKTYSSDIYVIYDTILNNINSVAKIVIIKPGSYNFGLRYFTTNNIESSVCVQDIKVFSGTLTGFDVDVVDKHNFSVTFENREENELFNENPTVQETLTLSFSDKHNTGNGILVKYGDTEKRIYRVNASNTNSASIATEINSTYPTKITYTGPSVINLNNNRNKTVNYKYNISAQYTSISAETSIITMPYTIETLIPNIYNEYNIEGAATVINNEDGTFTLNAVWVDNAESSNVTIKTIITSGNYINEYQQVITINYTNADANNSEDMEPDTFYLVDKNRSMFKITVDGENIDSPSYTGDADDIVGIAYCWDDNTTDLDDSKVGTNAGKHSVAIALHDLPQGALTISAYNTGELIQTQSASRACIRYNGYEITTKIINDVNYGFGTNPTNANNYVVYNAYHYFDEYPAIQGYLGAFGEYALIFSIKFDELNKILEYYGGDKIESKNNNNNDIYYRTLTMVSNASEFYIVKTGNINTDNSYGNWGFVRYNYSSSMCKSRACIYID